MKYLGKLITALFIVVLLICQSPLVHVSKAASEDQWQVIKKRGVLKVGLSADYAPMEFERTVQGERE